MGHRHFHTHNRGIKQLNKKKKQQENLYSVDLSENVKGISLVFFFFVSLFGYKCYNGAKKK